MNAEDELKWFDLTDGIRREFDRNCRLLFLENNWQLQRHKELLETIQRGNGPFVPQYIIVYTTIGEKECAILDDLDKAHKAYNKLRV